MEYIEPKTFFMNKNLCQTLINGVVFSTLISLSGCKKDLKDTATLSTTSQQPTKSILTPNLSTTGIGGYDLKGTNDQVIAFDGGHSGLQDYLFCYRPGNGIAWLLSHSLNNSFLPVYRSNSGIAEYNLLQPFDLITPFDYEHSGKQDFLVAYRPGFYNVNANAIYIIKNNSTLANPTVTFHAIIQSHDGLGNAFIINPTKVTSFDFDHSGRNDYLLIAKFDQGIVWVLKNNNDGTFSQVYSTDFGLDQDHFTGSYGLYDFTNNERRDYIFAFDYNHSGLQDHLVHCTTFNSLIEQTANSWFTTNIYIDAHNPDGTWTTKTIVTYHEDDRTSNIYQLNATQCIPFDYEHSGRADYLFVAQPNPLYPRIYILKNNNDGTMTTVFQSVNGEGIGGWDFRNDGDRVTAFDYDHSGKMDYLFIYRAGTGVCSIIKNTNGVFTPVL